jgi:FkbM family methyltransferase
MSNPAPAQRPVVAGGARPGDPAELRRIATALEAAADDFVKTGDPGRLARLQDLRREAVEALLALDRPPDPGLHASLSAITAACLRSGVRSFPRTGREEDLLAGAQDALASAHDDRAVAPALAAALLARDAFELQALPRLAAVPDGLRTAWLTLLVERPQAFVDPGDGERFGLYLQRLCDDIGEHLRTTAAPVDDVLGAFFGSPLFMQGYFNELNLRGVMRARGAIIEHLVTRRGAVLDQLRVAAPCADRPRIGFIMRFLGDGPETTALAAHMERLDRRRFDVRLYSIGPPSGRVGALCCAAAQTHVQLPREPLAAVARLRNENLDMAVFSTNLTAIPHEVAQVAAHRVARIQTTTIASPVTTGLRNMDVMVSGALNETAESPDHYTERLVALPGALNCYPFNYSLEGLESPGPVARAAHGIPEDAVVFLSTANFYKIVPELSVQWLGILAQVPGSYLMLMPFNPNWSSNYPIVPFIARLRTQAAAAGISHERLRLHAAVPSIAHLHRVMEIADVYLDAFPFSGACSLYDPLHVGLPIVARTGTTCRSRHSTAILEEAGLGDWAVSGETAYVERAVALGRDAARRAAERAQLARAREAGLKLIDTAGFAAKLMPVLDTLLSDWDARVAALHALTPAALAQRVAAFVPEVAAERAAFTDRDLVVEVVLPYLRAGGSRRLIDIGACVGAMSSPFLAEGWQTVMFEPDPRCHPTLAALADRHPGQVRIETAAVTADRDGSVLFHIAGSPGLSGLSRSPFAADLATREVPALAIAPYIMRNGLFDVDFVKIDAEGHDFEILVGLDLGQIAPRLIMVEFGDQFAGQDRAAIESLAQRMNGRGYRACVVCLRALGDLTRQEWGTGLLAIGIDAVPELPAGAPLFGNILFFRADDGDFAPSLCDWLEQFGDRKRRGLSPLR